MTEPGGLPGAKRLWPISGIIGDPRNATLRQGPPMGVSVNTRPPAKSATATEPFKHVIDEYKHRDQTITCTCGWHGSSAQIDRGPSEWTSHLIEVRGKKR